MRTDGKSNPREVTYIDMSKISVVPRPAQVAGKSRLMKERAQTKTVDGVELPMSVFAYVGDPQKVSTWKLPLKDSADGSYSKGRVSAAVQAISPAGYRGNRAEIPSADMPKVRRKLLSAYRAVFPDKGDDELPNILKKAANGGENNNPEGNMPNKNPDLVAVAKEVAEGLAKELGEGVQDKLDVISASVQTALEKQQGETKKLIEDELFKAMSGDMSDAEKAYMMKMPMESRKAYMGMSPDERKYMMKMPEDKKKQYMGMSPMDRRKMMRKSQDEDEYVEVGGQKMFKSQTEPGTFAMFKAMQAENDILKKSQREALEKAEMNELMRKAESEFPNIPGTTEEKAQMLKSLNSIPETEQKPFLALMKAENEKLGKAFSPVGTSQGGGNESAGEELQKMAKAYAEKNNVSEAEGYEKVLETEKGQNLYNATIR